MTRKKILSVFLVIKVVLQSISAEESNFAFYEIFIGSELSIAIYNYLGTQIELDIPSQINGFPVGIIEEGSFGSKRLSHVIIPDTVLRIFARAFERNYLTSITIPSRVETIGSLAFFDNHLTDIVLPNSVREIGIGAFSFNRLIDIIIPNRLEIIEHNTFAHNQLTNVIIPDSVIRIESAAFASNQLSSIIIPSGVTFIGHTAFENNPLTRIVIGENVILERNIWTGLSPFNNGFTEFYLENGSRTGTYVLINEGWTLQE